MVYLDFFGFAAQSQTKPIRAKHILQLQHKPMKNKNISFQVLKSTIHPLLQVYITKDSDRPFQLKIKILEILFFFSTKNKKQNYSMT